LHSFLEVQVGALPKPHLHDALVFPRGLHHLLTFFDGNAYRLLNIYVLPRLAGHYSRKGMPMVRCGDDNDVNIFVVENLPKVLQRFCLSARRRQPFL
jgi:hypothetical protein